MHTAERRVIVDQHSIRRHMVSFSRRWQQTLWCILGTTLGCAGPAQHSLPAPLCSAGELTPSLWVETDLRIAPASIRLPVNARRTANDSRATWQTSGLFVLAQTYDGERHAFGGGCAPGTLDCAQIGHISECEVAPADSSFAALQVAELRSPQGRGRFLAVGWWKLGVTRWLEVGATADDPATASAVVRTVRVNNSNAGPN